MRWYLGYPVLALGVAFGANTFLPSAPPDIASAKAEHPLDLALQSPPIVIDGADIDGADMAPASLAPPSRLAAFSPGPLLLMAEAPVRRSVLDYLAATLMPLDAAPEPAVTVEPITASTWVSAVIPAVATLSADGTTSKPATPVALARSIQSELRRVGCYLGEVDGIWGGGSKRAMGMFMDRVNAALPTDQPDVFMLSLLRTETDAICSACPDGQSLTASGRCVPSTLIAQAGERERGTRDRLARADAAEGADGARRGSAMDWEPAMVQQAEVRRPPLEGRMSMGGPMPDEDMLPAGRSRAVGAAPLAGEQRHQFTAVFDDDAMAGGEPIAEVTPAAYAQDETANRPARANKRTANRAKSRPTNQRRAYRNVQRLFQHPLGRM